MPNTVSAAAELAIDGGPAVCAEPVPFMSPVLIESDIEAAVEVLRSGMLRQATRCAKLEENFAATTDAKIGLTCANGTCALQLAYEPLFDAGDEVIVPAWTYIATASMIVARGATPVFCDVHEDTYNIDVADAAKRITPKTKAIACTHLYGNPADIDGVQRLAAEHGLKVIYDAAQAHLARYDGKGVGAYGDAVTYSFYATKNMSTGEGGMVTCNDAELAARIAALRSHGETDKYLHTSIGYNYRMTDVEAAIGLGQLNRLPASNDARRSVAARYNEGFADLDQLDTPGVTPKGECVYHQYTIRLNLDRLSCTRDEFQAALKAEGVPSAVHYPRPLSRQPALERFVTEPTHISDTLADRVLCLPVHAGLSDEHVARVIESVRKVAGAKRA